MFRAASVSVDTHPTASTDLHRGRALGRHLDGAQRAGARDLLRELLGDEALAAEPNVDLRWSTAPAALSVERDAAHVTLDDDTTLHAALAVGADGARSKLRELAGIEVREYDYDQRALVCHFATELAHGAVARQRFLPGGPVAMLPMADGRCSLAWFRPEAEAERILALDDAAFLDELSEATDFALGRVTAATPRRATLRQSLRHQGELLTLRRRGPKRKPRPVVVLCDISGSMEPYARMLLHFMHAVAERMDRVESFVFGTRLTRITRALERRDIDAALADVSADVNDWAGGTRIGEAIKAFKYDWLRRTLRSGGVVLVISDGCDRGDTTLLEREMARLHRNCHRLLWLNPLLRYDGYEPLTQGMQAALPHIDDFLPVHNLESLEQLGQTLTDLAR